MNCDPVDAIMHVMQQSFDPAYGEAWNRRQVADALILANTDCLLIGADPAEPPRGPEETLGFALFRRAVDEEELLLIAVLPRHRGRGVGLQLLTRLAADAKRRGTRRIFLEMREGNPAERLYEKFGFERIAKRRNYYRSAKDGPLDAITFSKIVE